jgi:CrcB protein
MHSTIATLTAYLSTHLGPILSAIAQRLSADPSWRAPIAIALGAIPGALGRYYLARLGNAWGLSLPWATLAANGSGAVAMGYFAVWAGQRLALPPDVRLLIGTGFLGAYTTFSTYALETVTLWEQGQRWGAIAYGLGSVGTGIIGIGLGAAWARQ